uniref:ANK_REP_REGION domain-containing protein n=1 Tax=Globodera rostochiensis TaxID=31243 RepID=A0A914HM12_GLORO
MGFLFSRFFYSAIEPSPKLEDDDNQKQEDSACCSNSENFSPPTVDGDNDDGTMSQSENGTLPLQSMHETPHKVFRKDGVKIFAAFVPDSPERYAFSEFSELKSFLNSPIGKKKGTRFKRCQDEQAVVTFYDEQRLLSSSMQGMCTMSDDQLDDSLNNSSSSSPTSGRSPISVEPDLPYKDVPARRLTEFRVAIEKGDVTKFDELLRESPRFLVNTSNDLPTILHIGMRCNAMHIACRSSNVYAVQRMLALVQNIEWLRDAYATDACVKERSDNLLDALLNTPDKIENNTPLHYACRQLCESIFRELVGHEQCHRKPVNSHNERPIDVLGRGVRSGTGRQESKKVFDRMYVALEGSLPSVHRRRRSPDRQQQLNASNDIGTL